MKFGLDADTLDPEFLPRPPPITPAQLATLATQPPKAGNRYGFISEEVEDLKDALSPSFDELTLSRIWWFLEILPAKVRVRMEDGTMKKRAMYVKSPLSISYLAFADVLVRLHWGRPRQIPAQHIQHGIKVHETVKSRIQYLCPQTETPADSENPAAIESISDETAKADEPERPSRKNSAFSFTGSNKAKQLAKWTFEETGGRFNGEKYKKEYKPKPVWDKEPEWTR